MSYALELAQLLEDEHGLAWRHNTKAATELRRLDDLVKEQAQEIERLRVQRVPLTEDHIADIAERMEASDPADSFWREFARSIEAAHGIHPLQRLTDLSKEIG